MTSEFVRAEKTQAWLSQFDPSDQAAALVLLQHMLLVGQSELTEGIRRLLIERCENGPLPIGLYVEREIRKWNGEPNRLFRESRGRVKSAFGVGPKPVLPSSHVDPRVGSEGIIAQLVSELCKQFPDKFLNSPGPDLIRSKKVRRFLLVTDYVGSGDRATAYLQSAWRVRSVRSWWSARATKGLSFEVVAYAATAAGKRRVTEHPSRPSVFAVAASPAIDDLPPGVRVPLTDLCKKYDPVAGKPEDSLGYGNIGALVAFAHGAPNNVPHLLTHASTRRNRIWVPLFPRRITSATRHAFRGSNLEDPEAVSMRLGALGQNRLARSDAVAVASLEVRTLILTLAALSRSPRSDEHVARRTGLTIMEVSNSVATATTNGWLTEARRLTDSGLAEIEKLRKPSSIENPLPKPAKSPYYPRQLRGPVGV